MVHPQNILQITDIIWVEHLEVMSYTRSSVNLRAYGQRDPLNEYRKEGTRLFKEMQDTTLHRIAEVIPNMQPEAIKKESEALQKQQARAQQSGGGTSGGKQNQKQRINKTEYGRNDIVKITNGNETKEIKYKKAAALLNDGWKITN